MSEEAERTAASRNADRVADPSGAQRKPWRTPTVIVSQFDSTETGPHTAADARGGLQKGPAS